MPEEKSCSTCVFDTVSRTSTVCATCESGAAYLHWRAKAAGYKLPEDMRPEVKYVFVPEYRGEEEEEEEEAAATTALDTQVGGGHYKKFTIQPAVFIEKNGLSFLEGCVVKRICRWKDKNGLEDLIKAKHEIDLLIEIHRVN